MVEVESVGPFGSVNARALPRRRTRILLYQCLFCCDPRFALLRYSPDRQIQMSRRTKLRPVQGPQISRREARQESNTQSSECPLRNLSARKGAQLARRETTGGRHAKILLRRMPKGIEFPADLCSHESHRSKPLYHLLLAGAWLGALPPIAQWAPHHLRSLTQPFRKSSGRSRS